MNLKDILKEKDVVFITRIMPSVGIYDVCDVTVRYVDEDWFTGVDKRDKRVYTINKKEYNERVFTNRDDALNVVRQAENNKPKRNFTIEMEE